VRDGPVHDRRCVADRSVAADFGVGEGSPGPLRRNDRGARRQLVRVQVKPRAGRDSGPSRAFRGSSRGFTRPWAPRGLRPFRVVLSFAVYGVAAGTSRMRLPPGSVGAAVGRFRKPAFGAGFRLKT